MILAQVTSPSDYAIFYEIKKVEKPAELPWGLIGSAVGVIVVIGAVILLLIKVAKHL